MERAERSQEQRSGKMVFLFYGVLVGLVVAGIVLTTARSDILNLIGTMLILVPLAFAVVRGRGPGVRIFPKGFKKDGTIHALGAEVGLRSEDRQEIGMEGLHAVFVFAVLI